MSANRAVTIERRLRENLERIEGRIAAACERAGREQAVRIVAVTKYAPFEAVRALVGLGHRTLGESRPQQLVERAAVLESPVEWHLIGHLQRNKVRPVLPRVELIHSVDSLRLLHRIDQIAGELALSPRLLLQVNVSGEESKEGFSPDELRRAWKEVTGSQNVRLCGLTTIAPLTAEEALLRSVFRRLRSLRDELQSNAEDHRLSDLSMGMSGDFEIAIEEGATLVRLGSVVFEGVES